MTLTSTGITSSPATAVCSGGNTFTFPSITFTSSSPTNVSVAQTDLAGNSSSLTTEVFTYTSGPTSGPGYQNGAVLLFDDLQKSSGVVKQEPVLRTYISPIDGSVLPCSPFNQYYKFGEQNERSEVRIWQAFLNRTLNTNLRLDGIYGRRTTKATKIFQTKYASEILIPWGITTPTGYTYKTTRAKGNQLLGCSEGPLVLKNGATVEIR